MILVVGATGQLGGVIARKLLEQKRQVRVLVRPHSDHGPLVTAGAEPVLADLKDRASLDAALRDVDVVITTASGGSRGGDDTPESVDHLGNLNLIAAAKAASVEQFIFTSTILANPQSPVPITRAKWLSEVALRDSGIPFTIFGAWGLLDVWVPLILGPAITTGGPVSLVGGGVRKHSFVCHEDVASFAVASIRHAAALNQHIPVGGPEPVSLREVVASAERALGRSIEIRAVAPGEPVPGLPDFVVGLMTFLETFDSGQDMSPIAERFGVRQTPLDEFTRGFVNRMMSASVG
jgi:uncharacterized protein YbjT (DUF2867 family)